MSDFEAGLETKLGFWWAGRLLGGHERKALSRAADEGAGESHCKPKISGKIPPGVFGWAGAVLAELPVCRGGRQEAGEGYAVLRSPER